MNFDGLPSLHDPQEALYSARLSFPRFYLIATPAEAELLDSLVVGHATLVLLSNGSRAPMAPGVQEGEGKPGANATDKLFEMIFGVMRQKLRASAAFIGLPASEQAEIEQALFEVKSPTHADERNSG